LKEDSFIFLPLLQVNSGYSLDLNTNGEKKEIFELSMINVKMIQRHLKHLMPKFIFRVNHPSIQIQEEQLFRILELYLFMKHQYLIIIAIMKLRII
jgi:hypothetical protein